MTKTIGKRLYKLTDQERDFFRWAKAGFLPEDVVLETKAIIKQDPDEPLLALAAVCRGKYGEPFGMAFFTYFAAGLFEKSRTAADEHRARLMGVLFKNVDLGGPICRPSARAIAEAKKIQAEAGR